MRRAVLTATVVVACLLALAGPARRIGGSGDRAIQASVSTLPATVAEAVTLLPPAPPRHMPAIETFGILAVATALVVASGRRATPGVHRTGNGPIRRGVRTRGPPTPPRPWFAAP